VPHHDAYFDQPSPLVHSTVYAGWMAGPPSTPLPLGQRDNRGQRAVSHQQTTPAGHPEVHMPYSDPARHPRAPFDQSSPQFQIPGHESGRAAPPSTPTRGGHRANRANKAVSYQTTHLVGHLAPHNGGHHSDPPPSLGHPTFFDRSTPQFHSPDYAGGMVVPPTTPSRGGKRANRGNRAVSYQTPPLAGHIPPHHGANHSDPPPGLGYPPNSDPSRYFDPPNSHVNSPGYAGGIAGPRTTPSHGGHGGNRAVSHQQPNSISYHTPHHSGNYSDPSRDAGLAVSAQHLPPSFDTPTPKPRHAIEATGQSIAPLGDDDGSTRAVPYEELATAGHAPPHRVRRHSDPPNGTSLTASSTPKPTRLNPLATPFNAFCGNRAVSAWLIRLPRNLSSNHDGYHSDPGHYSSSDHYSTSDDHTDAGNRFGPPPAFCLTGLYYAEHPTALLASTDFIPPTILAPYQDMPVSTLPPGRVDAFARDMGYAGHSKKFNVLPAAYYDLAGRMHRSGAPGSPLFKPKKPKKKKKKKKSRKGDKRWNRTWTWSKKKKQQKRRKGKDVKRKDNKKENNKEEDSKSKDSKGENSKREDDEGEDSKGDNYGGEDYDGEDSGGEYSDGEDSEGEDGEGTEGEKTNEQEEQVEQTDEDIGTPQEQVEKEGEDADIPTLQSD
jgi:hypothetical protein